MLELSPSAVRTQSTPPAKAPEADIRGGVDEQQFWEDAVLGDEAQQPGAAPEVQPGSAPEASQDGTLELDLETLIDESLA